MNVNKCHVLSKKEWTMSIRSIDQLVDVVLQLLGMGYLFLWILFLKDTVEIRNNMPIYLILLAT